MGILSIILKERMSLQMATIQLHTITTTDNQNSGETTEIKPIWDNLYGTIEPANLIIANVPAFYKIHLPPLLIMPVWEKDIIS